MSARTDIKDVNHEAMAEESGTETAEARDATQEEKTTDHHAETEICLMIAVGLVEEEETVETVETAEIAMRMERHQGNRSARRAHLHHQRSASQHQI